MTQPVFETTAAALREKSKLRASAATPSCPAKRCSSPWCRCCSSTTPGWRRRADQELGGRIRADPGAQRRHHVDGFRGPLGRPAGLPERGRRGTAALPGFRRRGREVADRGAFHRRPRDRALGIDPGADTSFGANRLLLREHRIHLENLTGLGEMPPSGGWVIVGGIRIRGGSGSPATVFGLIP